VTAFAQAPPQRIEVAHAPPVLDVRDLAVHIFTRQGVGRAVDGVSLEIARGETLGLVGESGSGKSLTALAIVGLHPRPASRIVAGEILVNGKDLVGLSDGELRRYRGSVVSLILQDPMTALNPVMTIGSQIAEPLRLHRGLRGAALNSRAATLLRLLRFQDPEKRLKAYPHQLSGGMRQRVVGAIAVSCSPDLLIADEPTTALDVTVQAAYLSLLKEIQGQSDLAILFITHDFSVVGKMCDRVAVMYAGQIVETASVPDVFREARHPYTIALLRSVPDVRLARQRLMSIPGRPPSVTDAPSGCRFHPRCWLYERLGKPEACRVTAPLLTTLGPRSRAACHFPAEAQSLGSEPIAEDG
jgi:oligopeptide/dipeptide ABC transporter ATP-binding protein